MEDSAHLIILLAVSLNLFLSLTVTGTMPLIKELKNNGSDGESSSCFYGV